MYGIRVSYIAFYEIGLKKNQPDYLAHCKPKSVSLSRSALQKVELILYIHIHIP